MRRQQGVESFKMAYINNNDNSNNINANNEGWNQVASAPLLSCVTGAEQDAYDPLPACHLRAAASTRAFTEQARGLTVSSAPGGATGLPRSR